MTDLNTLMHRMGEINAKDATDLIAVDIDTVIAYHRAQRARRAAGEKPSKPASASVDISEITKKLLKEAKPVVNMTRRI